MTSIKDAGFSLVEMMVSMVIVAIIGVAASSMLITFFRGTHEASELSVRVATASMMAATLDHTVAQSGYGEDAPAISVSSSVVSATWSEGGQSCSGTMQVVAGGLTWTAASAADTSTANETCGAGTAFIQAGNGWTFSMKPDTNCNYNSGASFPILLAANPSMNLKVPVCLPNLSGQ